MSGEPTIPQAPDAVHGRRIVGVVVAAALTFTLAWLASVELLEERRAVLGGELDARALVTPAPIDRPLLLDPAPPAAPSPERFRWVDRDAGVVAIPLDVAVRVVAERGSAP